jgi:phosphoribosylpyrophosphate synthetase
MPYPGITINTCDFSKDVMGKDIMLVDDLYTNSVNIDEDAIQALFDKGANSVVFYSIGAKLGVK